MDGLLPHEHRPRDCTGVGAIATPRCPAPVQYHFDQAPHTDKQHAQPAEPPRTIGQNPPRHGVDVVVADIHHDVEPRWLWAAMASCMARYRRTTTGSRPIAAH